MMRTAFFALLALVVSSFSPIEAQEPSLTIDEMATTIRSMNYTVEKASATKLKIIAAHGFFFLETQGEARDISYYAFLGDIDPDLQFYSFLNTYNAGAKFGRLYYQTDNGLILQMDRNVTGGVTKANITSDIETFALLAAKFMSEYGVPEK